MDQAVEWFEDEGLGSFSGFDVLQRRIVNARLASQSKNDVVFDRPKRAAMRNLKALAALLRPSPTGFDFI